MRITPKGASSPHLICRVLFAALLTPVSGFQSDLHAQEQRVGAEIWGRILLAGDTISLPGTLVELLGQSATTTASRTGFYRLAALRPGPETLRVRRLGYRSVTLEVELQENRTERRDIHLERLPAALTEVRVEGQLRKVPPRFEGVYRRMSTANGKFFTREDIEHLNPPDVQSLLMRVSTLRVNDEGLHFAKCEAGGAYALVPGGGRGNTGVQIYIDGVRMTGRISTAGLNEQREVLKLVIPSQIQAIEVYTGVSRIPGEFLDDACAVIAIWTRSY